MLTTSQCVMDEMNVLVEKLRSSGYDGRNRSIAEAPRLKGTQITALCQLEVIASQIAVLWLDGDGSESKQLIKDNFLSKAAALASIINSTLDERETFTGWSGALRLIEHLQVSEFDDADYGNNVVSLLVAVMVLRQMAEGSPSNFVAASSNVAPQFYTRCVSAIGKRPFGACDGTSLFQLAGQLASIAAEPMTIATSSTRKQSI